VIAGLVLGLAGLLGANRILQSQLIGVLPYDAPTLIVAAALLITVALLGSMLPVRQASRVDPAVTLRHE
jgi:ABC-type antimicrobial peptide transport system permease subunit